MANLPQSPVFTLPSLFVSPANRLIVPIYVVSSTCVGLMRTLVLVAGDAPHVSKVRVYVPTFIFPCVP
ncbi:hypothetical protein HY792_07545 [Candidatus Desantisbacteria bacterium]|nr:hypothetical protein [Candidatus Desantisbacteria bacterium]